MNRTEIVALMTSAVWSGGAWSAEAEAMYDALVRAGLLTSTDPVDLHHECCEEVGELRRSLGKAWSAWLGLLVDHNPELILDMRVLEPELMHKLHQYLSGQIEPVRRPTPACTSTLSSTGSTPS